MHDSDHNGGSFLRAVLLTTLEVHECPSNGGLSQEVHLDNVNRFAADFLGEHKDLWLHCFTMSHDRTPLVYPVHIIRIVISVLCVNID